MDRQYERVEQLLADRHDQLERIVGRLIQKETLEGSELEALLEPETAGVH